MARIGGTTHLCIGQEAVPVGVSARLDRTTTHVVSTHRGHGHLLAKGARESTVRWRRSRVAKGAIASRQGRQPARRGARDRPHGLATASPAAACRSARGWRSAHNDCAATGRCVVAYLGDGAADTGQLPRVAQPRRRSGSLPVVYRAREQRLRDVDAGGSKRVGVRVVLRTGRRATSGMARREHDRRQRRATPCARCDRAAARARASGRGPGAARVPDLPAVRALARATLASTAARDEEKRAGGTKRPAARC
jgi:hypothetical protein